MEHWAQQLFPRAFWVPGDGGYFWLTIPRITDAETGKKYYYSSRRDVNALLARLGIAVGRAVIAAGFQHTTNQPRVEIKGGFSTSTTPRDEHGLPEGPRKVGDLNGSHTAKIPTIPSDITVEQVDAFFDGCDYSIAEIERIIAACPPAPPTFEQKLAQIEALIAEEEAEEGGQGAVAACRHPRRPTRDPKTMTKPGMYWFVCAEIVRKMKPPSRQAIRDQADTIVHQANDLYVELGLGDDVFDDDRKKSLTAALRKVTETFNPEKLGYYAVRNKHDDSWFSDDHDGEENDIRKTMARLGDMMERDPSFHQHFDKLNDIQKQRGHPRVTLRHLAVAHLTMAKDVHTHENYVPHKAVLRMFHSKRHNLPATPDTVSMSLRLLAGRTIFQAGDAFKGTMALGSLTWILGRCRRWKIMADWYPYQDGHGAISALGHNPDALQDVQRALQQAPRMAATNGIYVADGAGDSSFLPIIEYEVDHSDCNITTWEYDDTNEVPSDEILVSDAEFREFEEENAPFRS